MTGTGDVSLESGKDTNLKGAVVSGEGVKVDVGGNLNVESQLDKERIKIDHTTISGGYGNNSANFDYTKQKGKGKSDTVNEQSGIHAGDSGFDIKVDGNTDLKGGLITSEAGEDKNKLETGTLTWSDVETKSEWSTKTSGFGGTVGPGTQGAPGSGPLIKPTLKDGDKDEGSAKTAVSPGEITITKPDEQKQDVNTLNRDTANTNDEIKGLPDLQKKLNEQLKTQQEWAKAAENMAKGVKEASDYMREHAKSEAEKKLWDEGGAARAALHAIAGGLLGGVNGLDGAIKAAIGAGVSTIIAPYVKKIVDQAIAQSGLKGEDAKRLSDTLTSSIVLGLLSGAGGSDTGGYASNEIKYNYLTEKQRKKAEKLAECWLNNDACEPGELETFNEQIALLLAESKQQTLIMMDVCNQGPSEACSAMMKDAQEFLDWHNTVFVDFDKWVILNSNNFSVKDKDALLGANLDSIAVDVYSRGLYGEEASREIAAQIARHDGRVQVVMGVVQIAGVAVCSAANIACVLGVSSALLGVNRLEQGAHQIITSKEQLSLIEKGLIATGVSQAQATEVLNLIETGDAIVTLGYGGYVIITSKLGKTIAVSKIGDEIVEGGSKSANVDNTTFEKLFPKGANGNQGVIDILNPNGKLIGTNTSGSRYFVRTVTPEEFNQLQTRLLQDATPAGPYANGNGIWYNLPAGGRIGVRKSVDNGVTLDFDVPGISNKFKIHQK